MKSFTKSLILLLTINLSLGCALNSRNADLDEQARNALVAEARWHEANDLPQDAITSYMGAVNLKPEAEIWYRIGLLHLKLDEEFPAMGAFEQSVALNSQFAAGFEEIGLLLLHWKQNAKAAVALQRALALDDQLWRSHNALAIIADLDKRHADAIEGYRAALALRPGSASILNNLGYSQFLNGESDEAAEYLVQAVGVDAEHDVAWSNLAKVMARDRRYADAFNILERKLPTAFAYHDVGYIALLNGDYVNAEEYLSKAMNASSTHFEAAFRNRTAARNRLIGNQEGLFVVRDDTEYPFCTGLGGSEC